MGEPNECSEEPSIYDDLIHQGDLGLTIHNLQARNKQLNDHVISLESDIQKLCNKISEMKQTQDNLSRNISELFRTAKSEIERKDRLIAELQSKLDEMIFRRYTQKSNFSFKRPCQETDENDVKKMRFNDKPNVENKDHVGDSVNSKNLKHSTERSSKSSLCSENKSNNATDKSTKDDNRKESSRHSSGYRRRSRSRDNQKRRESDRDRKRSDVKRRSRERFDKHKHDKDKKESSHKGRQSSSEDSQAKSCISSNKSAKDSIIQIESKNSKGQLDLEKSSSLEEEMKKSTVISESKKDHGDEKERNESIERLETKKSSVQSESLKRVKSELKFQKEPTVNNSKSRCSISTVQFKSTKSTIHSRSKERISDQSKLEKTIKPSQATTIIDLNESREEGELSDDLEAGTKNERTRKSTKISRKISPKDEKSKTVRSKSTKVNVKEQNKVDSVKVSRKQSNDTKKKIDENESQKKSKELENNHEQKSDKCVMENEQQSNLKENKNKTEKITILSQIVVHEAEKMESTTAKLPENIQISETKRSETKTEEFTRRINPPSSGVPRNLTNELDINLNKSKQLENVTDQSRKLKRKITSLFDTPIKEALIKKIMNSTCESTGDGDIPTIESIESEDLKKEDQLKLTSTPVTEFQIFKSNLVSSEISRALQFQDEEKLIEKSNSKIKKDEKSIDGVPKKMVENENDGYGSTTDMNNFSLGLLNEHFGKYKPEDFPNLTAVHSEEKNTKFAEPETLKKNEEILKDSSIKTENVSINTSLNSSDDKGVDNSVGLNTIEPKRRRRRCFMKLSE